MSIVIIGLGRLGEAVLEGLLNAGTPTGDVVGVERDAGRTEYLSARHPGLRIETDPAAAAGGARVVLLAVPPAHTVEAARLIGPALGRDTVVVSLAAGVSLKELHNALPDGMTVVRAVTNEPIRIGLAMTVLSPDEPAAMELFHPLGAVLVVPESEQDVATAVAASGPAYLYRLADALTDAAQDQGLSGPDARDLVVRTLAGAAGLLTTGNVDAARDTTPGWATRTALDVLDQAELGGIVTEAVRATVTRIREHGGHDDRLAHWADLPVTAVRAAADGGWDQPLSLYPGTADLDGWLDGHSADIAVEVCFGRIFLGAGLGSLPAEDRAAFPRRMLDAVRSGGWTHLGQADAYWRLPDGTPLSHSGPPRTLQVGAVVLWREGDRSASTSGLPDEPRAVPIAVTAAWPDPVPTWIGVEVSEEEDGAHRLNRVRLREAIATLLGPATSPGHPY